MQVLVVAHPDDDALFAGANLLLSTGWHVVLATHGDDERGEQFRRNIRALPTVHSFKAFNERDWYYAQHAGEAFVNTSLVQHVHEIGRLKREGSLPHLHLVLTHSALGECALDHSLLFIICSSARPC